MIDEGQDDYDDGNTVVWTCNDCGLSGVDPHSRICETLWNNWEDE